MYKVLSIIALTVLPLVFTQPNWKKAASVNQSSDLLEVDNLGQIYISNEDEVLMLDQSLKQLFSYSNKSLGKPTSIDCSDPFKILLFYRDDQKIQLLDNKLSESTDPLDLSSQSSELVDPVLACTSFDNGFWIYDQYQAELLRFNENLENDQRSGNLIQLFAEEINFSRIIEDNHSLYANDSTNGIFVFDRYANFTRKIPLTGINDFQVQGNLLIYKKQDSLYRFNMQTLIEKSVNIPVNLSRKVRYNEKKLYIQLADSLLIYKELSN